MVSLSELIVVLKNERNVAILAITKYIRKKKPVPGYTVICPYPGCPVSLYPGLQTHSNDSGTSTQFCVVMLQLCRPLRHSFSKGHRVEAHTRDT